MARRINLAGNDISNSSGGAEGDQHNQDDLAGLLRNLAGQLGDQHLGALNKAYPSQGFENVGEAQTFFNKASIPVIIQKHINKIQEVLAQGNNESEESESIENDAEGESEGTQEASSGSDEDEDDSDDSNEEGSDEGEGEGEGEGDSNIEDRLKALEVWREKTVDPALEAGQIGNPTINSASTPLQLPPQQIDNTSILELALAGLAQNQNQLVELIEPDEFEMVLRMCKAGIPVLMIGPAGSGKTTMGELVARDLKLPFGVISCSGGMTTMDLIGSLMPTGAGGSFEFVASKFTEMCQRPGVFLLDEIDAADENLLLVLNAAIAQREFQIPTLNIQTLPVFKQKKIFKEVEEAFQEKVLEVLGTEHIRSVSDLMRVVGDEVFHAINNTISTIKLHPEFKILAAANTFGTGADRVYVGRNQLDEASLDRFRAGRVEVDYSFKVEKAILLPEVLYFGVACRVALKELGMTRRIVSTRFLKDISKMKKLYDWTLKDFYRQLTIGWKPEEVVRFTEMATKKLTEIVSNGGL